MPLICLLLKHCSLWIRWTIAHCVSSSQESSSFSFKSCLPGGYEFLLVSGFATFVFERLYLDRDKFWATFAVHLSFGLSCFIVSAYVMWVLLWIFSWLSSNRVALMFLIMALLSSAIERRSLSLTKSYVSANMLIESATHRRLHVFFRSQSVVKDFYLVCNLTFFIFFFNM